MCPRLLLNISVWTLSVTGKNEGLLNSSNSILPYNIFQQNDLCILSIHDTSLSEGRYVSTFQVKHRYLCDDA